MSLLSVPLHAEIVATNIRLGLTYRGACDASAAAPVDQDRFVIATDEMDDDKSALVNRLHVYRRNATEPASHLDVTPAVQNKNLPTHPDKDKRECDFEGAARIGNRVFWITSHGPNKSGKARPDRYRFMATDVKATPQPLQLVGTAYGNLFNDLAGDPRLATLRLSDLVSTPPENGGLNIEGLARTREGALLIGLRSPLVQGKAVLVPLLNAPALVTGAETKAKLAAPIFIDLESRGIRDIAYWQANDVYIIVAGSPSNAETFAMYSWTIGATPRRLKDDAGRDVSFNGLHLESLVLLESGELLALSDDGDELFGASKTTPNKELPSVERTFRSVAMRLVANSKK